MMYQQRRSKLFPYTTLFRSRGGPRMKPSESVSAYALIAPPCSPPRAWSAMLANPAGANASAVNRKTASSTRCERTARSEEHTSELQSRENLVCRLLLEKKKI